MAPRAVVAMDTWRVITDELTRVAPQEGVVLPLVSLVRNGRAPHPCVVTQMKDLDGVVLSRALTVPALLQHNSAVHVVALPGADAWLDARVMAAVTTEPALRTAAYLHSHPFATGRTSPSGPDIQGHMRPMLAQKMDEGLHVSFSFIACRSFKRDQPWLLHAFACTPEATVVDLGITEVVDEQHPWVQNARLPHGRHRGMRGNIRKWRRAAGERNTTVDDLMDGWVRLKVRVSKQQLLVVLLGHATARTEHVLWVDGKGAPHPWDPAVAATEHLERAQRLATCAA